MTAAAHIRQARVYLAQARATRHQPWRFTLLRWAAAQRLRAAAARTPRQITIF